MSAIVQFNSFSQAETPGFLQSDAYARDHSTQKVQDFHCQIYCRYQERYSGADWPPTFERIRRDFGLCTSWFSALAGRRWYWPTTWTTSWQLWSVELPTFGWRTTITPNFVDKAFIESAYAVAYYGVDGEVWPPGFTAQFRTASGWSIQSHLSDPGFSDIFLILRYEGKLFEQPHLALVQTKKAEGAPEDFPLHCYFQNMGGIPIWTYSHDLIYTENLTDVESYNITDPRTFTICPMPAFTDVNEGIIDPVAYGASTLQCRTNLVSFALE